MLLIGCVRIGCMPPRLQDDAARYSHPLWPRHPPLTRGTGNQSGRSCGTLRAAPDVLQRHRAGRQERFSGEYRESRKGATHESPEAIRVGLISAGCWTNSTGDATLHVPRGLPKPGLEDTGLSYSFGLSLHASETILTLPTAKGV